MLRNESSGCNPSIYYQRRRQTQSIFFKSMSSQTRSPSIFSDGGNLENAVGNVSLWRTSRPRSGTRAHNKNVILAHFSAAIILADGPLTELVNSWLRSLFVRAHRGLAHVLQDFFPPLPRFPPSFKAASADFTPWPNPPDPLLLLLLLLRGAHRHQSDLSEVSPQLPLINRQPPTSTRQFFKTNSAVCRF